MPLSTGPRKIANLSESLRQQLSAYAIAASAAGVTVLAVAQPAQTKIVYTPSDKWLPLNRTFYLDLNHDGVNDFRFRLVSTSNRGSYARNLDMFEAKSNQSRNAVYRIVSDYYQCAAALPKGRKVGPKSRFSPPLQGGIMFQKSYLSNEHISVCPWLGVKKQAYLGLRFTIEGQVHYGWARFGYISANHRPKAKLTGYAYETISNKPIITGNIVGDTKGDDEIDHHMEQPNPTSLNVPSPKPTTLGELALGAPGLSIWRREEAAAGQSN